MAYPWVLHCLHFTSKFMGPEMGNIKRNFMGYLKGCHVFFGVKIHEKPINLDQEDPVKNH